MAANKKILDGFFLEALTKRSAGVARLRRPRPCSLALGPTPGVLLGPLK